jgi:hypothetical protein
VAASGFPGGSSGLRAKAEEAATSSNVKVGRVVKRVLLEEAAVRDGSEATQAAEKQRDVGDPKLDFDFERGAP